jgi:DNA-binding NarL/FixJ family response regulator
VLADDNYLVREGLARAVEGPDISIVAMCSDSDELQAAVERERPDVVLTDIRMPPGDSEEGIRVAAALRRTHPSVGVVVLSQYAVAEYAIALFDGGSDRRAYLLKDRISDPGQLVGAIRAVADGGSAVDSRIVDIVIAARGSVPSPLDELTPREREILSLMAMGPILVAAFVPLFVTSPNTRWVQVVVGLGSWIVFVVDFAVQLCIDREYLRRRVGRFDLVIVLVTFPFYLLPGAVGVSWILLLARLGRVARVLITTRRLRRFALRLGKVALVGCSVTAIASLAASRGRAQDQPRVCDHRRRAVVGRRHPDHSRLRRHRAQDHRRAARRSGHHVHRPRRARRPGRLPGRVVPHQRERTRERRHRRIVHRRGLAADRAQRPPLGDRGITHGASGHKQAPTRLRLNPVRVARPGDRRDWISHDGGA